MAKSRLRTQDMQKLAQMAAENKSTREMGREIGVSATTACRNLKRPEVQDLVAIARERLADKWQDVSERALAHITDKKLESSSASQLGVIAGIGSEKTMLLRGGPNGQGVQVNIIVADPTVRQITVQKDNDVIDITPE